ncbi:hypothetical protein J2T10_000760 [Paenarthrobacter nicotinovorans]|uniref:Uncharacterized protein n=1 Tax=Paenarthrobacter nicotinovorans TaxID=29320 RepID=A0ABT9TJ79_PAENI|nr:hypothetical protein [Paenarthrobacter nicotinovorans]MDQ0101141.1 hypothetical protein [Paenarthrobacter nicotinovorans]
MSSRKRSVQVKPFVWDSGKPNAKPGVLMRDRAGQITHLTFAEARKLADTIHDVCDIAEQSQEEKP